MSDISIILNVYKRPDTLAQQIEALLSQSVPVKPEDIHIWYNEGGVEHPIPEYPGIKRYQCSWNTKFWGRFTVPLYLDTPYVALFDDDINPGTRWLENCLDTMEKQPGILGGAGVTLQGNGYMPHTKQGWNATKSDTIQRVDLVGHAWFFRQEWTKYLWYEKPYTWDNGEDIMFSYLAQKHGGIQTYVPPHPEHDPSLWASDFEYGVHHGNRPEATFFTQDHRSLRDRTCQHCIANGWKPVFMG